MSHDNNASFLEKWYREHFVELCYAIRKRYGAGPPDPEDVVQSAFLKLSQPEIASRVRNPRAMIFIIARNLIMDSKRSAKVVNRYISEQIAFDRELSLEEITPERVLIHRERFDTLTEAMRDLPKKQRIVLYMSRIDGKTYREISDETGWSTADISRSMKAGIEALALAVRRGKP